VNLKNIENLVKMGMLKPEKTNDNEVQGLIHSGRARLKDSEHEFLGEESRFDLAYNAAHSLALAALRLKGYRANNRYVVLLLPLPLYRAAGALCALFSPDTLFFMKTQWGFSFLA